MMKIIPKYSYTMVDSTVTLNFQILAEHLSTDEKNC